MSKPITDDFPEEARVALAYLLKDMVEGSRIRGWSDVQNELCWTGRVAGKAPGGEEYFAGTVDLLRELDWRKVYVFCERVYRRLLKPVQLYHPDMGDWVETESLADVKTYFEEELNYLLRESSIGYVFVSGHFQRRGRLQTQKNVQRVGAVLSQPRLEPVRRHFVKARRFFDSDLDPDTPNCVKEAVCALEACVEIVTGKPASKDFLRAIKQLEGNQPGLIPSPLAQGMLKLHSYRGDAQGVAHAALKGGNVSEIEAEVVLSLVATYITYLADLFPEEDEALPF